MFGGGQPSRKVSSFDWWTVPRLERRHRLEPGVAFVHRRMPYTVVCGVRACERGG